MILTRGIPSRAYVDRAGGGELKIEEDGIDGLEGDGILLVEFGCHVRVNGRGLYEAETNRICSGKDVYL